MIKEKQILKVWDKEIRKWYKREKRNKKLPALGSLFGWNDEEVILRNKCAYSEAKINELNNNIGALQRKYIEAAVIALQLNNGAVTFELPLEIAPCDNKCRRSRIKTAKLLRGDYKYVCEVKRSRLITLLADKHNNVLMAGLVFDETNNKEKQLRSHFVEDLYIDYIVSATGSAFNYNDCGAFCIFNGFKSQGTSIMAGRIYSFISKVMHGEGIQENYFEERFSRVGRLYADEFPVFHTNHLFAMPNTTAFFRDTDNQKIPAGIQDSTIDRESKLAELEGMLDAKLMKLPDQQILWSATHCYEDFFYKNESGVHIRTDGVWEKKRKFMALTENEFFSIESMDFRGGIKFDETEGCNEMSDDIFRYLKECLSGLVTGGKKDGKPFSIRMTSNNKYYEVRKAVSVDNIFADLSKHEAKKKYLALIKKYHPEQPDGDAKLFLDVQRMYEEYKVVNNYGYNNSKNGK